MSNISTGQHVDNRTAAIIVIILSVTVFGTYIIQQIDFESQAVEDNVSSINLTLTASGFISVFVILEKNEINKYAIRVMNTVLAVYFPIISILPLLLDPFYNLGWFMVIYLGGMLFWFFVVCPYVIGKDNLLDSEDNVQKQFARRSATVLLRSLVYIFFGIIVMYIVSLYIKTIQF